MNDADPIRLRAVLGDAGIDAGVEARGALAVLTPTAGALDVTPELRRRLVAAARDCGFSHVALEVTSPPNERM